MKIFPCGEGLAPNAPAHRERPDRAPSASAAPQRGRDAVARLVRVVFTERVFPHFLLLLACSCGVGFYPPLFSFFGTFHFVPVPLISFHALMLRGCGAQGL